MCSAVGQINNVSAEHAAAITHVFGVATQFGTAPNDKQHADTAASEKPCRIRPKAKQVDYQEQSASRQQQRKCQKNFFDTDFFRDMILLATKQCGRNFYFCHNVF